MKIMQVVTHIGDESAGPSYSVPSLCTALQNNGCDITLYTLLDIPDKKFGSRPIAFLKTNNYDSLKRKQIRKSLSKHLPKYKIPDAFYKWPTGQVFLKPNRADLISLHNNQSSEEIE